MTLGACIKGSTTQDLTLGRQRAVVQPKVMMSGPVCQDLTLDAQLFVLFDSQVCSRCVHGLHVVQIVANSENLGNISFFI